MAQARRASRGMARGQGEPGSPHRTCRAAPGAPAWRGGGVGGALLQVSPRSRGLEAGRWRSWGQWSRRRHLVAVCQPEPSPPRGQGSPEGPRTSPGFRAPHCLWLVCLGIQGPLGSAPRHPVFLGLNLHQAGLGIPPSQQHQIPVTRCPPHLGQGQEQDTNRAGVRGEAHTCRGMRTQPHAGTGVHTCVHAQMEVL